MKIAVLMKEVVDLVEELVIKDDGTDLDRDEFAYKSNEFDDFALEEALQMRGEGDTIDVYALDGDQADSMLHTAFARGADSLTRVVINDRDFEEGISSVDSAQGFAKVLEGKGYDLILTGVQGVADLNGPIAGHVAAMMGLSNLNVITRVDPSEDNKVTCMKEFPGGVIGEFVVELPAVIGIQTSRKPPTYIPVSKVRKAAKEATINEVEVDVAELKVNTISSVKMPESGSHAEMIEGDMTTQVNRFIEILKGKGLL